MKRKTKKKEWYTGSPIKVETIDSETWAASGGTAGIYGKMWLEGKLRIIREDENQRN